MDIYLNQTTFFGFIYEKKKKGKTALGQNYDLMAYLKEGYVKKKWFDLFL